MGNLEIQYYEHLCACGCDGKIEVKKYHKWVKIPEFIFGHQNRGLNSPSKQGWVREKLSKIHKNLWVEGKEKGNTGKIQSPESRNKMSNSLKGRKAWNKNIPCTYKEKVSNGLTEAILKNDGVSFGFKGLKKGYFLSNKNNKDIFYGSSYELEAYKILEDSVFVKNYDRCHFSISYYFEGKRRYIPDILVEYITGIKDIIEVKPFALLCYGKNPNKLEALKNYSEKNRIKCSVWTEFELGLI